MSANNHVAAHPLNRRVHLRGGDRAAGNATLAATGPGFAGFFFPLLQPMLGMSGKLDREV
jgi:hypothetical protein